MRRPRHPCSSVVKTGERSPSVVLRLRVAVSPAPSVVPPVILAKSLADLPGMVYTAAGGVTNAFFSVCRFIVFFSLSL